MTSRTKFTPVDPAPSEAHGIIRGVIRPNQLHQMVGFSHHTARRTPGFPEPVQLGKRSIGWRVKDLEAWLDARPTGYLSVEAASPNLDRRRVRVA